MKLETETMGIAAEVAIAKTFNVPVSANYALRANPEILNFLLDSNSIKTIFEQNDIPTPIQHVAENQNSIDFLLKRKKTLSVKSNQKNLGKVAPQNIGQPTQETFFNYLTTHNIIPNFDIIKILKNHHLPDNYNNRAKIFKELALKNTTILVKEYWKNLFDCDFYLHFFNLKNLENPLNNYVVFPKSLFDRNWKQENFSFTQTLDTWNESATLKYCGITIGEFQVHSKRNCFKFRFNMKGIKNLLDNNII